MHSQLENHKRFNRLKRVGITLMLSASVLSGVTGCQSVGGVDLNKVGTQYIAQLSSKASSNASLKLEWSPEQLATKSPQEQVILSMLSLIELNISDARKQDSFNASKRGEWMTPQGPIPFLIQENGDQVLLSAEGLLQPLIITTNTSNFSQAEQQLQQTGLYDEESSKALIEQMQQAMQSFTEEVKKKLPEMLTRSMRILPNFPVTEVKSEKRMVHGELVDGQTIHIEMKGDQVLDWVKRLLLTLKNDERGTRALLSTVYDLYIPLFESMPFFSENEELMQMLQNKTLVVEFAYGAFRSMIERTLEDFDASVGATLTTSPELQSVLGAQQHYKGDFFVDRDLRIRAIQTEVVLAGLVNKQGEPSLIKSLSFKSVDELWDYGVPTEIEQVDISNGSVEIQPNNSSAEQRAAQWSSLRENIVPDSVLGRYLQLFNGTE